MYYKPLPIEVDKFEMLITRGYYFINTTMLIKERRWRDEYFGGSG